MKIIRLQRPRDLKVLNLFKVKQKIAVFTYLLFIFQLDTALKQQRLPAWQPILTAKTVLPLFFVIGVIFEILGGVLLSYSDKVNEYVYDYTNCISNDGTGNQCSAYNYTHPFVCQCVIPIELSTDFEAPVYLYYGLKNFYQNHRRYVKSRDDNQLLGQTYSSLNSECEPYAKNGSQFVAPCGAIANSLFNGN